MSFSEKVLQLLLHVPLGLLAGLRFVKLDDLTKTFIIKRLFEVFVSSLVGWEKFQQAENLMCYFYMHQFNRNRHNLLIK